MQNGIEILLNIYIKDPIEPFSSSIFVLLLSIKKLYYTLYTTEFPFLATVTMRNVTGFESRFAQNQYVKLRWGMCFFDTCNARLSWSGIFISPSFAKIHIF
jgi:hypothetical protein